MRPYCHFQPSYHRCRRYFKKVRELISGRSISQKVFLPIAPFLNSTHFKCASVASKIFKGMEKDLTFFLVTSGGLIPGHSPLLGSLGMTIGIGDGGHGCTFFYLRSFGTLLPFSASWRAIRTRSEWTIARLQQRPIQTHMPFHNGFPPSSIPSLRNRLGA